MTYEFSETEAAWPDEPRPQFDSDTEPAGNPENNGHAPATPADPFPGLTHAQVLALEPQGADELVQDLIEIGVVGVIAGVPESHKSWLAQAIAIRVAQGTGEILGQPVLTSGNVGYFWQDDSRRNEIDRIQTYERVHQSPPELSLWWYLNEGLELPRDLQRLHATITEHNLVLVIIDSFYNVASVDMKDTEAGDLVKGLKNRICDKTGCTILIVDHMPWATDQNRGRLRAYGDVFKSAAARFTIAIDADKDKLWIEARGNNIKGFKRTPAAWDPDTLELRLLDATEVADEQYEQRLLDHLQEHPWTGKTDLIEKVEGKARILRESLKRLIDAGTVQIRPAQALGRPGRAELLALTEWPNQAPTQTVPDAGTVGTVKSAASPDEVEPSQPSLPYGGTGQLGTAQHDTTDSDDDIPF